MSRKLSATGRARVPWTCPRCGRLAPWEKPNGVECHCWQTRGSGFSDDDRLALRRVRRFLEAE